MNNNEDVKNTKARERILQILKNQKGPVTAETIYQKVIKDNINLSTVYRTLATFESEGMIEKEVGQENKSLYTLKHKEHFHILECCACKKRFSLDYCPYHEVNKEIYKNTGFQVQEHNIVIYGLCPECQNKLK